MMVGDGDAIIGGRRRFVRRRCASLALLALPLWFLWLLFAWRLHLLPSLPAARADATSSLSDDVPLDVNDGPSNLHEGRRLFQRGQYGAASAHLWRAVVLHTQGDNHQLYKVDDAFTPFLQCYLLQDKVVDGLVFVAAESYMRGQNEMGELYLGQALERDAGHAAAVQLKALIDEGGDGNDVKHAWKFKRLKEIRDGVDASNPANERSKEEDGASDGSFWDQFAKDSAKATASDSSNDLDHKSPEELYNLGTHYFNTKNLPRAAELFELSCRKSNNKLSVACTNAVYLRTNLCDWGHRGEGFERDMQIIQEVTRAETTMYRSIEEGASEHVRRLVGMGIRKEDEDVIHWQRATSVHPHMMLGYPLSNDNAILKRYVAESMASLDELRARVNDDGTIQDRPADLPYSVKAMRDEFQEKHRQQLHNGGQAAPIKVGFVACSFNSKAVLYLSHDMFRFFDPDIVEIHVFSTGAPDHPLFIQGTMRGVDWRQRVIDAVDYFHDVREYQSDHVGLARYIHEREIEILVEWDGYARQGERAAGLMALRPAPIQVLHQEFLMTSGAQYFDYIVTDMVASPPEKEGLYTEKFLYLPNHFFSKGHRVQKEVIPPSLDYIPKEHGAEFQIGVGSPQENACLSPHPFGADSNGQEVSFVYCNFNKFLKHNPETMRSWLRVLEEVPNSILCLLENPKEGIPNLRKFVDDVAAPGSDSDADGPNGKVKSTLNDRIHFIEWEKNPFDHQQRSHSLCNAMLDSHPYNGHTTAQDALYAGVPIVTRSDGDDMASRVSTSANIVLGLEELNAYGGSEDYENIAIRLGKDEAWFRSIRRRLVDTCLQNPMHPYWDVPRYVGNFQRGLQLVWERFLAGKEIDHVEVTEESGDDDHLIGTTEAELDAREKKRNIAKRKRAADPMDEL